MNIIIAVSAHKLPGSALYSSCTTLQWVCRPQGHEYHHSWIIDKCPCTPQSAMHAQGFSLKGFSLHRHIHSSVKPVYGGHPSTSASNELVAIERWPEYTALAECRPKMLLRWEGGGGGSSNSPQNYWGLPDFLQWKRGQGAPGTQATPPTYAGNGGNFGSQPL